MSICFEDDIESSILPKILLAKFLNLLQILGKGQSLVYYRRDSAYLMAQEMLTAELSQEILILVYGDFPPTGKGIVNRQEIRVACAIVSTMRTHTLKERLTYSEPGFCPVCFLFLSEGGQEWRL